VAQKLATREQNMKRNMELVKGHMVAKGTSKVRPH
jgi:hypothetical protein